MKWIGLQGNWYNTALIIIGKSVQYNFLSSAPLWTSYMYSYWYWYIEWTDFSIEFIFLWFYFGNFLWYFVGVRWAKRRDSSQFSLCEHLLPSPGPSPRERSHLPQTPLQWRPRHLPRHPTTTPTRPRQHPENLPSLRGKGPSIGDIERWHQGAVCKRTCWAGAEMGGVCVNQRRCGNRLQQEEFRGPEVDGYLCAGSGARSGRPQSK